ncbi:MAG: secretin N-terminal domain-containing protein [Candidatus Omnitrophica bacterium]|jgi:type IV pilus assembly protein PilQ|nr:secretin N-terminal domain-containing protein [Candidatus Omnitrophota bacterium]MDD5661311.1 secretin N-terminal domain-containing protein [Candidatus Omnitrophota bacterium]
MKKIFLTTAVAFYLFFAFFIAHLNAQDKPDLTGSLEPTISMDFKDASLKDILKALSMQSGMNFIASEAVQDRKVTLYFDKVPLTQVVDKIFSANNLSYELDPKANIFVVNEWGKMETQTITKVFYLKNASVSTSALKADMSKNASDSSLSSSSSDSASTSTSTSSSGPTGGKWKVEEESGITYSVRKLLSTHGSVIEDFRTNSLIVTDTPMKIQMISQVIASLDVPVAQVMLEVEMLDVSKDLVDKIGFEFGETPFTAIVTGATAGMGFPYHSWGKLLDKGAGELSINPAGSTYQMQLDYLRTATDTKFLARPKLLTLNNETAEIAITKDEIVGREDTTTFDQGSPTTTSVYKRSTDLALTKEGTGIFLRVTPQINLETNEITMVVNPKSSVSSISELSSASNPQSDIEVRSTRSIVKVKDGETVVLGGLIHHDKKVIITKLPILGDIPILGMLFRHKEQPDGLEREMIVFITPRIVREKADISRLSEVKNLQLPVREQGVAVNTARDYIINSNMNKFEKNINGKR